MRFLNRRYNIYCSNYLVILLIIIIIVFLLYWSGFNYYLIVNIRLDTNKKKISKLLDITITVFQNATKLQKFLQCEMYICQWSNEKYNKRKAISINNLIRRFWSKKQLKIQICNYFLLLHYPVLDVWRTQITASLGTA